MVEVGLGYLRLGEPTSFPSGGESQRLRIASRLRSSQRGALHVFDEPSTGLHPLDVAGRCCSTPPTTTTPAAAIERLITVAGFDPVKAGGVSDAGRIDMPGGDLHEAELGGKLLDAEQARAAVTAA